MLPGAEEGEHWREFEEVACQSLVRRTPSMEQCGMQQSAGRRLHRLSHLATKLDGGGRGRGSVKRCSGVFVESDGAQLAT